MILEVLPDPNSPQVFMVYTACMRLFGSDYHVPLDMWEWSVN